MTLNDRIKEFYKNDTFCEKNCQLNNINYENIFVTCNCTIKDNFDVKDLNFDLVNYTIEKKKENYKVLKCHEFIIFKR